MRRLACLTMALAASELGADRTPARLEERLRAVCNVTFWYTSYSLPLPSGRHMSSRECWHGCVHTSSVIGALRHRHPCLAMGITCTSHESPSCEECWWVRQRCYVDSSGVNNNSSIKAGPSQTILSPYRARAAVSQFHHHAETPLPPAHTSRTSSAPNDSTAARQTLVTPYGHPFRTPSSLRPCKGN